MTERLPDSEPTLEEKLTAYLLGESTPEESLEVEKALASQPSFAARKAELEAALELLRSGAGAASLPAEKREALRDAALSPASWWGNPAWKVAAILVVAIGLTFLNPSQVQESTNRLDAHLPQSIEALSAPSESLVLMDGLLMDSSLGNLNRPSQQENLYLGMKFAPDQEDKLRARHGAGGRVQSGRLDRAGVLRVKTLESINAIEETRFRANAGFEAPYSPVPVGGDSAGAELVLGEKFQGGEDWWGLGSLQERKRIRGRNSIYGWNLDSLLLHLRPRHENETPRDMFFRFYGDHAFVEAERDALSTFAADVDTASYPLARSYLVNGNLPPREAIRTEEFLNWFRHDLAAPQEGDFAIHMDASSSPFGEEGALLLRVGIKAREVARADRKSLNLVFVIDKSGSMKKQDRLNLVKRSLELLVDQLREDDTVGLVTFDSQAHLVLEPTRGETRWEIREALRSISAGGSTNAGAGLDMGYDLAERAFREGAINRVILCSDGVANTGETDQVRILEKVKSSAERQIDLTSIGVGMGNHNDVFLEQLADKGDGSCHYVDDFAEAKRVLVDRFTGTLQTIARDTKIQVEFNPAAVARWRQLGYENRAVADSDFRNDSVDAGEVGAGHEVIALYEIVPRKKAVPGINLATARVRWMPDGESEVLEIEAGLDSGNAHSRFGLAPAPFRLAVVTAQFAEVLRLSFHARGDSYAALVGHVGRLAGDYPGRKEVSELRDMVARTRELIEAIPPMDDLALLVEEVRRSRLLQSRLSQEDEGVAELLAEVRKHNEELEARLAQVLEGRG